MKASIDFTVPKTHKCYSDHFPVQAIVPGALLMEWVTNCWNEQQKGAFSVQQIPGMKFLSPVYPGDQLRFDYEAKETGVVQVTCIKQTENGDLLPVAKGKFV